MCRNLEEVEDARRIEPSPNQIESGARGSSGPPCPNPINLHISLT